MFTIRNHIHLKNKIIMKNLIKKLTLLLTLTSFTSIYSQSYEATIDNTLSSFDVRIVVFDAGNNQIGTATVLAGATGSIACTSGVPSFIHFIEESMGCGTGGCIWSENVNTSGSCSTCTACNCWSTTSPFFSNTMASSTSCAPIGNLLTITITN